jgi:hypothetical protein
MQLVGQQVGSPGVVVPLAIAAGNVDVEQDLLGWLFSTDADAAKIGKRGAAGPAFSNGGE